ncbi:flavin reductase family protein [Sedimentitalea todarodis]|uniref:Flavin reductase family protein n=1 Tax=Sedimentitalea todarodis TaxID=1631240 RepID=A0ABU3VH05_9RHOB|nr:flavin reductase family protein [Sedimentitalea todarodis]MDU9005368.1 flavin reductase family protein [Sedimentitalea todarodis]
MKSDVTQQFHDPSPERMREALGGFATGVAVVTCGAVGKNACAVTINSFTSVSLDPPLILFCLDRSAFHLVRFLAAESFAVNILSDTQMDLSNRLTQEVMDGLEDLDTGALATGCPVFPDALAALDCQRERVIEAGDHHILIGRVVAIRPPATVDPLLYFRGRYAALRR